MTRAIIALGANLPSIFGQPSETVHWAIRQLDTLPQTHVIRTSSLHITEPVDISPHETLSSDKSDNSIKPEQNELSSQIPLFVNAVSLIETQFEPLQLLDALQELENKTGRIRHCIPDVKISRTLDLDIIAMENVKMDTKRLTLPHPKTFSREFVLTPLQELHLHEFQTDFV